MFMIEEKKNKQKKFVHKIPMKFIWYIFFFFFFIQTRPQAQVVVWA